jgi:type II secretory pathway pseudopilin PulG
VFDLRILLIATLSSAAISGGAATYYTARYKDGEYAQKLLEQERLANEALQKEKDRASQAERDFIAARDKLEIANAKNEKRIKDLTAKYNAAIDAGSRLRDPGARTSCSNASSEDSRSSADVANGTGAELSEEASRFLLSEAARADSIVGQLNLCKAWAAEVKAILENYRQDIP